MTSTTLLSPVAYKENMCKYFSIPSIISSDNPDHLLMLTLSYV